MAWKRRPLPTVYRMQRDWVTPCQASKLYAQPNWFNGCRAAAWIALPSSYSKKWRKQPLYPLLAWTTDQHQETHMPAMGILWSVVVVQVPTVKLPLVKLTSKLKPTTENKYLRKMKGIIGISLIRHLGLMLLKHSSEANNTPYCVPWNKWWQQNHFMLTWSFCKPHIGGSHCNIVKVNVPGHKTATGGLVAVTRTSDIMKNSLQQNNSINWS